MELLAGNLDKVVQHGKRAEFDRQEHAAALARGIWGAQGCRHQRARGGELNLAYHGARAEKQGFNVTIERSLDPSAGEIDVLPQEITRVFLT